MTQPIRMNQLFHTRVHPGTTNLEPKGPDRKQQITTDTSFHNLLAEKMIRFSHHAEQRLQQRGIQLRPDQLQKINAAMDKAAGKGAKDSLILLKDMALIVNVQSRTVVTAMDNGMLKDNVFTQIDSAVIMT